MKKKVGAIGRRRKGDAAKELRTIRLLVSGVDSGLCPSCKMPFDKSRKRRLIDSCGHERCYSCIFKNDSCPVCLEAGSSPSKFSKVGGNAMSISSLGQAASQNDLREEDPAKFKVYGTPLTKRRVLGGSRLFRFSRKGSKNRHQIDTKSSKTIPSSPLSFDMKSSKTLPGRSSQESGFLSSDSLPALRSIDRSNSGNFSDRGENDPNTNNVDISADSMMSLSSHSVATSARDLANSLNKSTKSLTKLPLWKTQSLKRRVPTHSQIYSQLSHWTLKPLYFEVPQQQPQYELIGRNWVFREVLDHLNSDLPTNRGVLITGAPGSGKTAIILSFVENSCFGRGDVASSAELSSSTSSVSLPPRIEDSMKTLSSWVVAYHFCQADNAPTCAIPEFIHSIASQMSQAPQLSAYFDLIMSDPELQRQLSQEQCMASPTNSLVKGILEPLNNLQRLGKITSDTCLIVVDALCDAEFHRSDAGDTLASFVAKHLMKFPPWLKIVCAVRSSMLEITKLMPFHKICLDNTDVDERLNKDLKDYISHRIRRSSTISTNISPPKVPDQDTASRLTSYLVHMAKGCFLYAKLTLDLIERGHLVIKSGSFKVLPYSLSEIFLLAFNLRFSSAKSFERVSDILTICLSSLQPMTLAEIFSAVTALSVSPELNWSDFLDRFQSVSEFLIQRADGSIMFFHPTLRDWLVKRRDGDSTKFLCDPRTGHAAIAFSLGRSGRLFRPEKVLELTHHILKAHLHKNYAGDTTLPARDLQASLISLAADDMSGALGCTKSIFNPIVKVSRLLLLSGASPNYITDHLEQAPLLAVYCHVGNKDMVSLLLEYGADVNKPNSTGKFPLYFAAVEGHLEIVQMLLQFGAQLNKVDKVDCCAMVAAARNGHMRVVEYLIDCDWITDQVNDLSLSEAAQQAMVTVSGGVQYQMLEFLLDMSEVDINLPDTLTGETALTTAARLGDRKTCEILFRRHASVDRTNLKDNTALHIAAKEGHWDITDILVKEGADIGRVDSLGRTPLMLAAGEGHSGVVDLLLSKGAFLETEDKEGLTPLCWASVRGHYKAVASLLDNDANINHADRSGRTPLDLAAYNGDPEVVELLLDKGAFMEHIDVKGMRPLDRAIGCRNAAAVNCFLRKGAKLGPATWAMANGKPEIMLILLNKLLEDGNTLFRKGHLREASHRYKYAIKRLPEDEGNFVDTFSQLKVHLLLNQSRCMRKQGSFTEAIELADQVIDINPDSFEALSARAKAKKESGNYEEALIDLNEALKLVPTNREVNKIILKVKEEMKHPGELVKLALGFDSSETISYIDDSSTNTSSLRS